MVNTRHGSPFDRGDADKYYGRPYDPHYYIGDTYNSPRVDKLQMTLAQIKQYSDGFKGE
jgi:hypothetical protein